VTGLSRKDTAKSRLNIAWTDTIADGEKQLDVKSILQELRGNDPRPLLVLRESSGDKKLARLLDRVFKNEKFQLVTQFYNCVKLSKDVADQAHPYAKLFGGKNSPHIVLASWDGTKIKKRLVTSKGKLDWKDVVGVLKVDYKKSADKAVKELSKLLNTFDTLDAARLNLRAQITRAEAKGQTGKLKGLKAKMAKVDKAFEAAFTKEQKAKDLGLRRAIVKAGD
jgi:hypothetical protein